jgi:putative oxidoreductase
MGNLAGGTEMIFGSRIRASIVVALRIVIAAMFIYAGVTKAVTPLRFATDIANFHLLPWMLTMPLALYLPWLEMGCGVALLLWRLDRGALLLLFGLTSIFVVALVSARIRGIDISCGCFGHGTRDLSFTSHLVLDLGILTILLLLLRASSFRRPAQKA